MSAPSPIPALHATYVRLSERKLILDPGREYAWMGWLLHRKDEPFTVADFELVFRWRKAKVKLDERREACLKFDNLVRDPHGFEQDLEDAKAELRKPKPNTARASVLAATGRVEAQPKSDPEVAAAVVKRCMERFRKEVG